MSPNFRIMRDGNGVHWVEYLHTTLFLRRKIWRAMLEYVGYYDGGGEWQRKNFPSKKSACHWLREYLASQEAARLRSERAKQHIDAGPC
jgi:hypothetical protein